MRAVVAREPGGHEQLEVVERAEPKPGPEDLLVRVRATAVNRADVLERQGLYRAPEEIGGVLGLELAGEVAGVGEAVEGWAVGDEVCGIVAGGAYAEYALLPAPTALPLPPGCDAVTAAAVPEVYLTALDNLLNRGRLAPGETVLVHGGSSGVGTAAIQLARRHGAGVLVTAGSAAKLAACVELGAAAGINYREEDFVEGVAAHTEGRGVDVILDLRGGDYLDRNLRALAAEGRLVLIGLMGGAKAEINLARVLTGHLTVHGSTLRPRSVPQKAALARQVREEVWPGFADGTLRPVIDRVLPLEQASEAHRVLEASEHIGKVVLRVD